MTDQLTNDQIALLCKIGEGSLPEPAVLADDQIRDLADRGYVAAVAGVPGPSLALTKKAIAFLGERGAGLNEA